MTRVLAGSALLFLVGAGIGWWTGNPREAVSSAPAAPTEAIPTVAPGRCVPGEAPERVREAREVLERENVLTEGSIAMDFGPPLVQPEHGFDPAEVRETVLRTLTLGRVHFSSCDTYPCTGLWDVSDEDPDAAAVQLRALRALYPDATTSWSEDAGPHMGFRPPGQIPFILHGPIDADPAADQNAEAPIGRVRWLSRALKSELRYQLGPDAPSESTTHETPENPQGGVPVPP